MKSLRNLYRIGHGPSSSHTIGPQRIAKFLKEKYQNLKSVGVVLYGSLAFTGRGHLTDKAIIDEFSPIPCVVLFDIHSKVDFPNTMDISLTFNDGKVLTKRAYSLGGGAISIEGDYEDNEDDVYPQKDFAEIRRYLKFLKMSLEEYVEHYEGKQIWDYLREVYHVMLDSIDRGLNAEGLIPGKLKVPRRAKSFLTPSHLNESSSSRSYRLLSAYAFATSEENASGGLVVTAPTCGSAGVLPSVLKYNQGRYNYTEDQIIKALAVAGVIGNVVKMNGSISGAEAGCQAEIGTACSMAAAAITYLKGFSLDQIEYAAEAAMEHSLGLTCDPVGGYVQIPCIERNAVAAVKAISACYLAEYASSTHRVSFDMIVQTMIDTGRDLKKAYRETSKGGLAIDYDKAIRKLKKQKMQAIKASRAKKAQNRKRAK